MITSSEIQDGIVVLLSDGEPHSVQEIRTHLEKINVIGYSDGQLSGSLNTLQRNGTIKKNDRGIYSLRQEGDADAATMKCFVVSPIGEEGGEIRKNADTLFKHIIEPACDACGFKAERADQMSDADSITQKVIDNLENADLVIADITGHNPNVFYEMGYRKRTSKPIIHIRKKGEELPFDISAIRTFDYDFDVESAAEFKEKLINVIKSFSYSSLDSNIESLEQDRASSPIVPMLHQILNAITELHSEVKYNDERTLKTIIESVHNMQPQMSQEDRLLQQLLPMLMQDPGKMMQLAKLAEKFPTNQNRTKSKR
ncbi:MAG: nucleoside 2-deoxyribosyltransferase [Defluviitaleaceae bacterium]|nr:nucleoside 2-deoxyribosyltransferase [Defluviitaleaceae bacterium]